jgi:hypothetical protein
MFYNKGTFEKLFTVIFAAAHASSNKRKINSLSFLIRTADKPQSSGLIKIQEDLTWVWMDVCQGNWTQCLLQYVAWVGCPREEPWKQRVS